MTITLLMKHRLLSTLAILLITLQITACSTEENNNETVANATVVNTANDITRPSAQEENNNETDTSATVDNTANDLTSPSAQIDLSWTAPAERENNTPISLSEIAGYRLYFGTVQGDYLNEIEIKDSSAETYALTDFAKGTYYFVITTYDTEGRESRYSPEIKITIWTTLNNTAGIFFFTSTGFHLKTHSHFLLNSS